MTNSGISEDNHSVTKYIIGVEGFTLDKERWCMQKGMWQRKLFYFKTLPKLEWLDGSYQLPILSN